jgi:transglutaminase-like putative cysteine protease
MHWTKLYFFTLCLLTFPGVAVAAEKISKEPVPDWVERIDPVAPNNSGRSDGSVRYILVDNQWHIEKQAAYSSFATTILTPAGAEEYSQLSVDFQPAYQHLVWHSLVVERGGVPQDRLSEVEFEVIRRESGLDMQLYDGRLTAHAILKDIRPGDSIRYSYSIIGSNPIFKGHVHSVYQLAYGVGVDRVHRSVIWNADKRNLQWQVEGAELTLEERTLDDGLRKLVYDRVDLKKWEAEQYSPTWFADYPFLELSDYENWQEFGEWALPLYWKEVELPAELKTICDEIAAKNSKKDQQVVEVLGWVQRNIRYLGSFFGEHTHEPYPLAQIIDRRYGDCKDKGVTTVAMLRYLGFDAAPALVNTYRLGAIKNYLPGHSNFDHLIVHLNFEGEDYWMDPTSAFQEGSLKQRYSHDYGYAYVIREGEDDLTVLKPRGQNLKQTILTEKFDISDMAGASDLKVTTVATGADADVLRRTFASSSLEAMEKIYREFYLSDYPEIEVVTPLEMEDDTASNRITVREHYRIKGLWFRNDEPSKTPVVNLYARFFASYVFVPEEIKRKSPYRIGHPVNVRHQIEVTMPEEWHIEPENMKESLPYGDYHYYSNGNGAVCTISYEWKSKRDHLKPEEYKSYRTLMGNADKKLRWVFSEPVPAFTSQHVMQSRLLLMGMVFIGFCMVAVFSWLFWRWDPPVRPAILGSPSGLAGWMVLPLIGCLISPFFALYEIIIYFSSIGDNGFSLFGDFPEQVKWLICYATSVLVQSVILFLMIFQIFLLFKMRTSFPYYYLGLCIAMVFFHFVLVYVQSLPFEMKNVGDDKAMSNSVSLIVRMIIWGSYMMLSQRVRATFVVSRNLKRPQKGPPPLPTAFVK